MEDSNTIRCNGCGARISVHGSYIVDEERACSPECVKRILLRDINQAADHWTTSTNAIEARTASFADDGEALSLKA